METFTNTNIPNSDRNIHLPCPRTELETFGFRNAYANRLSHGGRQKYAVQLFHAYYLIILFYTNWYRLLNRFFAANSLNIWLSDSGWSSEFS